MKKNTIPVQVDNVMQEGFNKVRCVYFRVEGAAGTDAWSYSMSEKNDIVLASWNDWAVLAGPSGSWKWGGKERLFDSPKLIERTIMNLERSESVFLDMAHIYLPEELFRQGTNENVIVNGDVYRMTMPLFRSCYMFVNESITEEDWIESCRALSKGIAPSPAETAAFRQWRKKEISFAREKYHAASYAPMRLKKKERKG
jgi:hypothetical protein